MNIVSIDAANFRRYPELHLDLPAGCSAIVGPNGAGKSSLLEAIDVALYGARSLSDYVTRGEAAMHVLVTFEHRGGLYRVRRAWKNGKTTLDLERLANEDGHDPTHIDTWEPLSRENVKATQGAIEQLLGLTRDTLHASSLLMQGDGAAFTSAQPGRRKEILFDALGLELWGGLLDRVRDELRQTDRDLAGAQATIGRLEQDVAGHLDLTVTRHRLEAAEADQRVELAKAEEELATVTERCQAAREHQARVEAAEVSVRAAGDERDRLVALEQRAASADRETTIAREELATLPTVTAIDELEQREQTLVATQREGEKAVADYKATVMLAETRTAEKARLEAQARTEQDRCAELIRRANDLQATPDAICDRCQQSLADEARALAVESMHREADEHGNLAKDLQTQANGVGIIEPVEPTIVDVAGELEQVRAALTRYRANLQQRARLEERIVQLQRDVDQRPTTGQLDLAHAALAAAEAARDALTPVDLLVLEVGLPSARAHVDHARGELAGTREQLASLRTRLEQIDKAQVDLTVARDAASGLLARIDQLKLGERAYGPNGIPALILENAAIPQIETEANRIISLLGRSYRFELRTQRELKSGDGLREALDIVVHTDDGESPYEAFSGGERTRINLALRIALARLVATRRGAEVKLLAIDEPDGLDVEGFTQLADVLRDLAGRGEFERVLVVSHHPELRHAFDSVIEVTGGGDTGRPSTIVAQLEAVAA